MVIMETINELDSRLRDIHAERKRLDMEEALVLQALASLRGLHAIDKADSVQAVGILGPDDGIAATATVSQAACTAPDAIEVDVPVERVACPQCGDDGRRDRRSKTKVVCYAGCQAKSMDVSKKTEVVLETTEGSVADPDAGRKAHGTIKEYRQHARGIESTGMKPLVPGGPNTAACGNCTFRKYNGSKLLAASPSCPIHGLKSEAPTARMDMAVVE